MRTLIPLLVLLSSTRPAIAHGGEEHAGLQQWTFDPWIVTPIALACALYGVGFLRLWQRSRDARRLLLSASAYWSGSLSLVIALVSPLHFLGEHLFTFHMVEHELMMAAAAPLLVLARPIGIVFWGLPRPARHVLVKLIKARATDNAWDFLTRGFVATALHALAIWLWHVPALFDATVTTILLHRLQHLSFLVTAIIFWWAIFYKMGRGAGAWHLFVTMMHTSILGALISLAPRVLYMSQTKAAPQWGMTPLEDQQLAGLVMWVPGGIIYACAALAMLAAWISASSRGGPHGQRID